MRSDDLPGQIDPLRRLARGLLIDKSRADDVVQQAWLTAARRATDGRFTLRALLAGVVRNLARQSLREDARRTAREHRAAHPERVASAADVAGRIEVTRRLLDALDCLEEPYRSAVVLRYFDDRKPREIARELGLPVNTVHTHIRRGLERLRQRIAMDRQDALPAFLALLTPLAGSPGPLALGLASAAKFSAFCGTLLMTGKSILGLAALGLIAILLWSTAPDVHQAIDLPSRAAPTAHGPDLDDQTRPDPAVATRELATQLAATGDDLPLLTISGTTACNWQAIGGVPVRIAIQALTAGATLAHQDVVTSDEQGRFEFSCPAPDRSVAITARAAGDGWTSWPESLLVAKGETAPPPLLIMVNRTDCEIGGTVVDEHGAPIAGVAVRADDAHALTDDLGRFTLRVGASFDATTIVAEREGYGRSRVSTRAGATPVDVRLVMRDEFQVSGTVTDDAGRPILGATVRSLILPAKAITDAQGNYTLRGFDPGDDMHILTATAPGFAPRQKQISVLAPGLRWIADHEDLLIVQREELTPHAAPLRRDFKLAPATRLSGRMLDEHGAPVEGAILFVGYNGEHTSTDAQGRFVYDNPPREPTRLIAQHARFAPTVRSVDLSSARADTQIDFTLAAGHFAGGVVVDNRGQPVPLAILSTSIDGEQVPGRWISAADGRFRCDRLPARGAVLIARGDGLLETAVTLDRVDRDDLRITLQPGGRIAGRVVGPGGAPIRSFQVRLTDRLQPGGTPAGIWSPWDKGIDFTDAEGRFDTGRMSLTPGARVDIRISAAGLAAVELRDVAIPLGPHPEPLLFRLGGNAIVRGDVRLSGDRPAAGATVRLFANDAGLRNDNVPIDVATTDDRGFFRLNAGAGRASLVVELADGRNHVDGPFDVPDGGSVVRHIEIGAGAIAGRTLDRDGNPLAGVTVHLAAIDDGAADSRQVTTDPLGQFAFANLRAGHYELSRPLLEDGQRVGSVGRRVRLAQDQQISVELQPIGDAVLRGRVGGGEGSTTPMRVWARRIADEGGATDTCSTAVAADGTFRIDGVAAGSWSLLVVYGTARSAETAVDVAPGGIADVTLAIHESNR